MRPRKPRLAATTPRYPVGTRPWLCCAVGCEGAATRATERRPGSSFLRPEAAQVRGQGETVLSAFQCLRFLPLEAPGVGPELPCLLVLGSEERGYPCLSPLMSPAVVPLPPKSFLEQALYWGRGDRAGGRGGRSEGLQNVWRRSSPHPLCSSPALRPQSCQSTGSWRD